MTQHRARHIRGAILRVAADSFAHLGKVRAVMSAVDDALSPRVRNIYLDYSAHWHLEEAAALFVDAAAHITAARMRNPAPAALCADHVPRSQPGRCVDDVVSTNPNFLLLCALVDALCERRAAAGGLERFAPQHGTVAARRNHNGETCFDHTVRAFVEGGATPSQVCATPGNTSDQAS